MEAIISGLFIHPVKSLKGIALDQAELTGQGLAYDRHWMLVNSQGGFLSQRQLPAMALVHTRLTNACLILSRAGMADLVLPLDYAGPGTELTVRVWRDECLALDEGDSAARWLQAAIGWDKPIRLVRMAPTFTRPQSKPELLGKSTSTFFADAAPYLIANQSSLDALNDVLEKKALAPVPINRFRPNILLTGLDAFSEHQTKTLNHSGYQLRFCYPCERCIMTTIDQDTATTHPAMEPFKTLAELNPMPDSPRKPAFAENGILIRGSGQWIRVGDRLEIQK